MTILHAMDDPNLFGPFFRDTASWRAWRVFLAALFGLPMDEDMRQVYGAHANRTTPPSLSAREAWMVVGRRGGKSRIAALIAVYLACFRSYEAVLVPGEMGTLPIIAADRKQARVLMGYVKGYLQNVPLLRQLVNGDAAESVRLKNRVQIEVHTASFRAVRGYTVVGAVLDEVAFWRTDDSANPDHEILAALRPAMATVPQAMLVGLSSPYAKRGVLWDAYDRHFGREGDPVLVWQAPTWAMNPTVPQAYLDEEREKDPVSFEAEHGAHFRDDVGRLVRPEMLDAATDRGISERPPERYTEYVAFCDPSGGSADSMTLAIAHLDEAGQAILDATVERIPPFSPERVVEEFARVLKAYRVYEVHGDRYGGEWPPERFAMHGISYRTSEFTKSELYLQWVALLNAGRCRLLHDGKLKAQFCGLERKTTRGGKDTVDHPPMGHDDVANAAAGALVLAAGSAVGDVAFGNLAHEARPTTDWSQARVS